MTIAGPAPGRRGSPTMAVPVVAKMPAPMVAPTPRAVRCHLPSERLSPPRSRMSFSQSCTDFRRKSRVMNVLSADRLGAALAGQGERDRRRAGHMGAIRAAGGGEPERADDLVELPGVVAITDLGIHHVAVDPAIHADPERHRE